MLLFGIISLLCIWLIPAILFCLIVKKIVKKKVSKGWCVFITASSFMISGLLEFLILFLLSNGKLILKFGFPEYFCGGLVISLIFGLLYDKTIPSILDTEKELKAKMSINKEV